MFDSKLPARIGRLNELAYNLWWSWHDEPRHMFRALDYPLWRLTGHNPVKLLREISPDSLQKAALDPAFVSQYDAVMAAFDEAMFSSDTWFATKYPGLLNGPVGYMSMEYAIHNSLPMYAGGLGILAGDHCKEASDLGLPMVAVGFMYPQGYFHQHISPDGWQQEVYQQLDFEEAPVSRVLSPKGELTVANIQLGNVDLAIGVWLVRVGRTTIYLLDTNMPENTPQYRQLSARLYVSDRELRLRQELVLGVGG
ncbi:MAG: alpha-glucan family phosphorylase, partial [Dehalococcoidales bacterium]|nr:alpha-glucan family phosphorylase [Dehalococcoidales bacterium]